jgi:phage gp36-like protein
VLTPETIRKFIHEDELLQIAGTGGRDTRVVDANRLGAAIDFANGLVAGFVRDRWPAVLSALSPMLDGFSADIARWHLRSLGGQQTAMNETVQKRYDEALARLKDIASGKLTPDFATGASVTGDGSLPGTEIEAAANESVVSVAMPVQRVPGLIADFRQ